MSSSSNAPQAEKITSGSVVAPKASTSVYEALYGRRMAWQYTDEPVSREAIQRMLETAVWAPNHRLTEPWRFFVTEKGSHTRQQVADLAYEFQMGRFDNPTRAEATRQAVLAPPIVMYVYCVPGDNDEVTKENYASTVCAAHNVSLAGVAEGLAVTWETGGATRHPKIREVLGAEEEWSMAMMLSIGAPGESVVSRRSPVDQFVRWMP